MTPEDRLLKALQNENHRRGVLAGLEPTEAQLLAGALALQQARDEHYLVADTVRHVWMAMNRRVA
jgi:hypothetical protein